VLRVESSSSSSLQIAASLEVESKRIKEPGLPARSDLTAAPALPCPTPRFKESREQVSYERSLEGTKGDSRRRIELLLATGGHSNRLRLPRDRPACD
jgi:hypothetical protein